MFKINKKLEYALMVLQHLTTKSPDHRASAREVSSSCKIPFDTTSKVMQVMSNKGLLKAEQGTAGGYKVAKPLDAISFLQLAESILGPVALTDCLNDMSSCHLEKTCNIVSPLFSLNQKFLDLCKTISLKDLFATSLTQQQTVGL